MSESAIFEIASNRMTVKGQNLANHYTNKGVSVSGISISVPAEEITIETEDGWEYVHDAAGNVIFVKIPMRHVEQIKVNQIPSTTTCSIL